MDNSKINFSDLWLMQNAEQPSTEDLLAKINTFKKSHRKKIILQNILLLATCAFIIFIWAYYQPKLLTSKIGIILMVLAMVIFVLSSNKGLDLLKTSNGTKSNQEYLKDLLAIKGRQQFMQTTILNLYFVLLSTGIALYMYEYAALMTTSWAILAYGITAAWILFNWFYIRPRQIKKQQKAINDIIIKFENIQTQLNQE